MSTWSRNTRGVRAAVGTDRQHGAVMPPLYLSANFTFDGLEGKREYDYTRSGNPTRDLLGEALAELEGGAGGVVTATGMAAITLVLNALLEPDHIHVPVTVVAIAEDRLVPVEDAYVLVERLRGASRLRVLRSRYGHDAFLKEQSPIATVLREALAADAGAAA